ncbi:MAG: hypothetical protein LBU89_09660 [Fibromonadaceae bacterium]|jgi:hypothetical protein|nr:hypothetical protein [Fibromonadaceae bacterium]
MNISKYLIPCIFTVSLALAQMPWEMPVSEEASTPSSEPEPEPFYSPPPPPPPPPPASSREPAPEAGKTIFDNVRGHAYNPYGTVGAARTVTDLVLLPSDIHGKKFFYVSPIDRLGYTAFDLGGASALLGLDNSVMGSPAALIFGYATPGFGLALDLSLSKSWQTTADDTDISTTNPGDNIGLYFSMPMGSMTLYANASWLTYDTSITMENDGNKSKTDASTIDANVGALGSAGSLNYDAYANVIRTGTATKTGNNTTASRDSHLGLILNFNLGYAALQSANARMIAGLNNAVGIRFYDGANAESNDNIIRATISPNILGEVALVDNWFAFGGAIHNLAFQIGDGDRESATSYMALLHGPRTEGFMGVRYQRTNWAFEAQVSTNPFGAFAGNNIFTSFGGFVYF